MSDVDDVTTAADHIEHLLPAHKPERETASKLMGSVADRLDHATRQQLTQLMRGGIGEPTP